MKQRIVSKQQSRKPLIINSGHPKILIRSDRHDEASRINVDLDERRSIDDPVDDIRRCSTVFQQLFKASPISFVSEIGVGFVLAVAKSVNIVVGPILADNLGGAPKAFSIAVVVVASAQARGVRLDKLPSTLRMRRADPASRKKYGGQNEEESCSFYNLFPASANGSFCSHFLVFI